MEEASFSRWKIMVYLEISNGSVIQVVINRRIIETFLAKKNYYYDRKVIIIVRKECH